MLLKQRKELGSIMRKKARSSAMILAVAALVGLMALGTTAIAADKNLVIAGSSVKGTWYRFAGGVASLVDKYIPGYSATAQPSPGSIKNLRDMRNGEVDIAMVLPDAAYQCYNAMAPFDKEKPFKDLRAIFNTYSFPMHILVKEESKIKSIKDIKGARIGAGPPGSTSMMVTKAILAEVGITPDQVSFRYMSVSENASALADGNVDVSFILTGKLSAAVSQLMTMHEVRYVPIDPAVLAALNKKQPYFVPGVVKAGSYGKVKQDVPCLTMWGVLSTTTKLSDEFVYKLTKAVFEHKAQLVKILKLAEEMTPQRAANDLPVPLHPGALKYYKEVGAIK